LAWPQPLVQQPAAAGVPLCLASSSAWLLLDRQLAEATPLLPGSCRACRQHPCSFAIVAKLCCIHSCTLSFVLSTLCCSIVLEVLPALMHITAPALRPVSQHLYSPVEQETMR
jgi:hypothetical protein